VGKFDEGIHIGYAINGHAYRVYNKRLLTVEESMHVVFDESDYYLPKSVLDEPEVDDLRTIIQKNQFIDLDTIDTCAFKEPVVNAELPKRLKNGSQKGNLLTTSVRQWLLFQK